ncbi:hypothetical protein QBC41DRAFT_324853 [Cercophora samala]|uniref:Uncharacterized protein n=1 Tax=Cercophora samala TaxID=330535 RepID=A0AA40D8J8_9PEZI|nr:hypothetical protein QBC41DRAFT_324853 [Cercophora samala]
MLNMADQVHFSYPPLSTPTSIRILILAPGEPDDETLCLLWRADLDADHDLFPNTTASDIVFTSQAGPARPGKMRVASSTKLYARGIIADRIAEVLSDSFPNSPPHKGSLFWIAFEGATELIRKHAPGSDSMEVIRHMMFLTSWCTESHLVSKKKNLQRLWNGFKDWYGTIISIALQQKIAARLTTTNTRFSVTEGGIFGLCPNHSAVGDQVAILDGSAVAFIVRDSGRGDESHVLVGIADLHGLGELERLSAEPSRDIV